MFHLSHLVQQQALCLTSTSQMQQRKVGKCNITLSGSQAGVQCVRVREQCAHFTQAQSFICDNRTTQAVKSLHIGHTSMSRSSFIIHTNYVCKGLHIFVHLKSHSQLYTSIIVSKLHPNSSAQYQQVDVSASLCLLRRPIYRIQKLQSSQLRGTMKQS